MLHASGPPRILHQLNTWRNNIQPNGRFKNHSKVWSFTKDTLPTPPPTIPLPKPKLWELFMYFFNLNHSKHFKTGFRLIQIQIPFKEKEVHTYKEDIGKGELTLLWPRYMFICFIDHYPQIYMNFFKIYIHDLNVWGSVRKFQQNIKKS